MRYFILFLVCLFCAFESQSALQGNEYTHTTDTGLEVTLGFDTHENRYYGRAVNRYFGSYVISPRRIYFSPLSSTMISGPEEDMQAEEKYFDFLRGVLTYQLTDSDLILISSDGKKINFKQKQPVQFK